MDAKSLLLNLILGIICGLLGQSLRIAVGIKKTYDEATAKGVTVSSLFDSAQFVVSLFLGASAGAMAALIYAISSKPLDQSIVAGLITAGYAGADFLEGIISNATSQVAGSAAQPPALTLPQPPAAPGLPGVK